MRTENNDQLTSPAMPSFFLPKETRVSILRRLRRLEGQTRGVQRMVEDGRDCREILDQIAAIKAAAHSLGSVVLENYVLACLHQQPELMTPDEAWGAVHEAIRQMVR